jgi:hypothetical protein
MTPLNLALVGVLLVALGTLIVARRRRASAEAKPATASSRAAAAPADLAARETAAALAPPLVGASLEDESSFDEAPMELADPEDRWAEEPLFDPMRPGLAHDEPPYPGPQVSPFAEQDDESPFAQRDDDAGFSEAAFDALFAEGAVAEESVAEEPVLGEPVLEESSIEDTGVEDALEEMQIEDSLDIGEHVPTEPESELEAEDEAEPQLAMPPLSTPLLRDDTYEEEPSDEAEPQEIPEIVTEPGWYVPGEIDLDWPPVAPAEPGASALAEGAATGQPLDAMAPADLSPADLSPADLSPADLSPADLSPADLSLADLSQPAPALDEADLTAPLAADPAPAEARLVDETGEADFDPAAGWTSLDDADDPELVAEEFPSLELSDPALGAVPTFASGGTPFEPGEPAAWLRSATDPDPNRAPGHEQAGMPSRVVGRGGPLTITVDPLSGWIPSDPEQPSLPPGAGGWQLTLHLELRPLPLDDRAER